MRAIYSVEGNIGSGKSTFLTVLKSHLHRIEVIPEPVAEWQHVSHRFNLLEEYYRDPTRWAFTFQINAILSRVKGLKNLLDLIEHESSQDKVFFSERSIVADREIFAKLLRRQGKMNQMEHALYLSMYQSLETLFRTPRIHKFIYLRSSPSKCRQRMLRRARHQELDIPLDYFTKIHDLHEDWLGQDPNTIIVEAEEEFETEPKRALQMVASVRNFLNL